MSLVAVIGAGQMGTGIAQVAAQAGCTVQLLDTQPGVALAGKSKLEASVRRSIEKGKIKEHEGAALLERIVVTDLDHIEREVDVAIEAIPESFELKRELFVILDERLAGRSILASNTSSVSITALAAATYRPDRVVGMHFMNPVPAMELVEVIRGLPTSDSTFRHVFELARRLGKQPVEVRESPGFLVNRILIPMLNEAIFALEGGLASAADIDLAMKLGTHQPMGPLALADLIGLDTVLSICETLHVELGDDKYRPAPLLRRYVAAGWHGRKAGRGFFAY